MIFKKVSVFVTAWTVFIALVLVCIINAIDHSPSPLSKLKFFHYSPAHHLVGADKRDKAAASGAEAATDATEDAEAVAAAGGALDVKPRAEKAVKPGKAPKVEEADVKSLAPKLEPKLESQVHPRT